MFLPTTPYSIGDLQSRNLKHMLKIFYSQDGSIAAVTGEWPEPLPMEITSLEPIQTIYPATKTLSEMGLLRRGTYQPEEELGILITHDMLQEMVYP